MTPGLKAIYAKLFDFFGPQHWWPGESAFEVMAGAILTQNTNWANVEKAMANLKKNNLLSLGELNKASPAKIAKLIRPCGYYNIKTKRLKCFLDFIFQDYQGDIRRMKQDDTMSLRGKLLKVKGIGPETADSILLYSLGKPVFVVDAYTRRVFSRHKIVNENDPYGDIQNLFMKKLKVEVKLFNEYHALIVRLGKEYCFKNKPDCRACPLGSLK